MLTTYSKLYLTLFLLWCVQPNFAQDKKANQDKWIRENRDLGTVKNLSAFQQLKFGMFIHWGLYAQLAGEWNGRQITAKRPYAEQINLTFQIPNSEYEQLVTRFNPVNFVADEWVAMAKQAGMKYLVFTSKHQDGFSMFKSACSDYNVYKATPFKRDPVSELSVACEKAGIQFGIYYSNARDFHEAGANWNTNGNTWDFPAQSLEDFEKYYYTKVLCQVRELLSNYGKIAVLWFDVPYKLTEKMSRDLKELVVSLQPRCVVNSRIGNGYGDYMSLGDNEISEKQLPFAWETCMTINDTWGYSRFDDNWKSAETLIHQLIDVTSKGGNYLLNIGPDGKGSFPVRSQKVLNEFGEWLGVYGEAIYDTKKSPDWLENEQWKCTVKPGKLFLHILNNKLRKITLNRQGLMVKKAYLLVNGEKISYSVSDQQLTLLLPEKPLNPYATVVVIEIPDF